MNVQFGTEAPVARASVVAQEVPWSVAPMMDRTDRHFRALVHCIAPRVRLYTEMAVAGGDLGRLQHGGVASPVAAQLAGVDVTHMADAAAIAERRGFSEINLNCGCPGPAAVAGGYGAPLMRSPERVARVVAAITQRVGLPVSVKCRTGTQPDADDATQWAALLAFVDCVAAAGCRHFIVHARAAHLQGLSPRDNRRVPTLRYDLVDRLARTRPALRIELNGGLTSVSAARAACRDSPIAGVMFGRAAYDDPLLLAEIDRPGLDRAALLREVLDAMADYVDAQRQQGVRAWAVVRHMLGVSRGLPGGKRIRMRLAALCHDPSADGRAVAAALSPPPARRAGDTSCPPGV